MAIEIIAQYYSRISIWAIYTSEYIYVTTFVAAGNIFKLFKGER